MKKGFIALWVALALVGCSSSPEPKSTSAPMTNDGTMKVNPPEADAPAEKTPEKPAESSTAKQSVEGIWTAQASDESGTHTFELHLEAGGSAILHIETVNPDKEPVSHSGTWSRAHAAIAVTVQPEEGQAWTAWMLREEGSSLTSQTQPEPLGAAKLVFTRPAG